MHLAGFIIRIYHEARSFECQKRELLLCAILQIYNISPSFPTVNLT